MKSGRRGRFIYETPSEMPSPPGIALIPAPMEETVSYGRGTGRGPAAILRASMQVEYYDRDLRRETCLQTGIETAKPVRASGAEAFIAAVRAACRAAAEKGMLPVVAGGEHTVTIGAVQAALERHDGPAVVQIDAHADLRQTYGGTPLSHACVMRRIREMDVEIISFGARAFSAEEAEFMSKDRGVAAVPPEAMGDRRSWRRLLASRLGGRPAYVTIDLDGLDPSIIPDVGTPVPGGLSWAEALDVIACACSSCSTVAGIDVVELSPSGRDGRSAFAAAQLLYHAVGRAALANGLLRG